MNKVVITLVAVAVGTVVKREIVKVVAEMMATSSVRPTAWIERDQCLAGRIVVVVVLFGHLFAVVAEKADAAAVVAVVVDVALVHIAFVVAGMFQEKRYLETEHEE